MTYSFPSKVHSIHASQVYISYLLLMMWMRQAMHANFPTALPAMKEEQIISGLKSQVTTSPNNKFSKYGKRMLLSWE